MRGYGITDVYPYLWKLSKFNIDVIHQWANYGPGLAEVSCSSVWWKTVVHIYYSWFLKRWLLHFIYLLIFIFFTLQKTVFLYRFQIFFN